MGGHVPKFTGKMYSHLVFFFQMTAITPHIPHTGNGMLADHTGSRQKVPGIVFGHPGVGKLKDIYIWSPARMFSFTGPCLTIVTGILLAIASATASRPSAPCPLTEFRVR